MYDFRPSRGLDSYMEHASNRGKVVQFAPRDYADEPTNEELGIEAYTGWKLIAAWTIAGLVGFGVLGTASWALYWIVAWFKQVTAG